MDKEILSTNKNFLIVDDFVRRAEGFKNQKTAECMKIQKAYTEQFSLEQKGPKRALNGFLLFQALWKIVSKMKLLDFSIKSSSADAESVKTVENGVDYVLKNSGFIESFTEKAGVFFRGLLFGDGFVRIGAGSCERPVRFESCSLNDLWLDPLACKLRSVGGSVDADEICFSFLYSLDEFKKLYPEAKEVLIGRVPVADRDTDEEKNLIEVLHYYCKSAEKYLVLAGANAITLQEIIGNDYPFRDKNQQVYLPLLQFICFPSLRGVYNSGLGNLLYSLHIETRKLMNMAISAISNRVDPLYTITMKKSKIAEFRNWVYKALEAKSRGEMGIVPVEIDESGQAEYGQVRSIIGAELTSEFERLFDKYDQIVKRIGINLDEIATVQNDTARHAILREENANSFVRQIMEQNAEEFRFAIECILTSIRDFVPHDDEKLGKVSELLNKYDFIVEVDSRSGAYPGHTVELARIDEMIKVLPTKSEAYKKALLSRAKLLGVDISAEDLKEGE